MWGAEESHEIFEYMCDISKVNVWFELLDDVVDPLLFQTTSLTETFISTSQNCLLSCKLKIP